MVTMSQKDESRRGKVEAIHIEEAGRLLAIWNRTKLTREANGVGSQEAFGAKYEVGNQAAVGFFLNGKTALGLLAAIRFARGLGCRVEDFSPRLAKELPEGDGGGGNAWPLPKLPPQRWAEFHPDDRAVAEDAYIKALQASHAQRQELAAPAKPGKRPSRAA
jgi:hypothetical protein